MQLNMTIDASPELLSVLGNIAQALRNLQSMPPLLGTSDASQDIPETLLSTQEITSACQANRSPDTTAIDRTDLTLEERSAIKQHN